MAHVKVDRQAVLGAIDKIAFTAVRRVAIEYQREVKRLMRDSPATGRVYPSRTGRGLHRASAPGEPPAPDTKTLLKAVTFAMGRGPGNEWEATAGVTGKAAEYAAALEYGTARILPRPAWRPAFQVAIERGNEILAKAGGPKVSGEAVSIEVGAVA
jgi:hypothetical protein